jgi:hypothetical protein
MRGKFMMIKPMIRTWPSIIGLIVYLAYCPCLAAAPNVTATPPSIAPGGTVTVTVSGSDGGLHNWVGLFAVGASNSSNPIIWEYLSGTQNLPSSGLTSATLTFVLPSNLAPGQYGSISNSITA